MVAEAIIAERRAANSPPIYDIHGFRSREAVGALVGRARKALAEEFGRELAPLGLNVVQALVLVLLAEQGVGTAAEMCRVLSHDAGAMTRIVDRLEQMRLVRRVRRERDRRLALLELTKEGRRMHTEVTRVQVAVLNRMLRGFSRAEARTLEKLLKRIVDNAAEQEAP
jgi:DNA-binding MarR family transcriptional regulator